jgi:hypothetical protein
VILPFWPDNLILPQNESHPMRPLLALSLLASPAFADGPLNLDRRATALPGAVATYVQAERLYELGQAAKDPLMVLIAARMMRGLSLTATARTPDPAPDPAPASAPTLAPLDVATMLATAHSLDAGDNYSDLIAATEILPTPKALRATAATLPPGAAQVWTLAFFGGTYGEIAIIGHANATLDLIVSDDNGNHICLDDGSAATALCGFTPADNGNFTVTVTNPGADPSSYVLLSN